MHGIPFDTKKQQCGAEATAFAIILTVFLIVIFCFMQLGYEMYEHAVIDHSISEASWEFTDADLKRYEGNYDALIKQRVAQVCPTLLEDNITIKDADLDKYTSTITHPLQQQDVNNYGLGQMQVITTKLIVRAHIFYRVEPIFPFALSKGSQYVYTLGKNITIAKKCEVS